MKIAVIGAGITGLAIALELSTRKIECVLIDNNYPGFGTTTKNAGHLHCGARYIVSSPKVARLCAQENIILRRSFSFAISDKRAMYLLLKSDPVEFRDKFLAGFRDLGIEVDCLTKEQAKKMEPNISDETKSAYMVPEFLMNPYSIVNSYVEELMKYSVDMKFGWNITDIQPDSNKWIMHLNNRDLGSNILKVNAIINATGPWASGILEFLNIKLKINYILGSMITLDQPLTNKRIISHCAPSSAGDVILSDGNLTLIGSTARRQTNNKLTPISEIELKEVLKNSSNLIPKIASSNIIRTYSGIRVEIKEKNNVYEDDFKGITIIDHEQRDGIKGIYTIFPGKMTLGRFAAEKLVDLLLKKYKIRSKCETRDYILEKPNKETNTLFENNII